MPKTCDEVKAALPKSLNQDLYREAVQYTPFGMIAYVESVEKELVILQGQLAEAQTALDRCGIGGIEAEFQSLGDAISQMAWHIKELEKQRDDARYQLDKAERRLTAYFNDMQTSDEQLVEARQHIAELEKQRDGQQVYWKQVNEDHWRAREALDDRVNELREQLQEATDAKD